MCVFVYKTKHSRRPTAASATAWAEGKKYMAPDTVLYFMWVQNAINVSCIIYISMFASSTCSFFLQLKFQAKRRSFACYIKWHLLVCSTKHTHANDGINLDLHDVAQGYRESICFMAAEAKKSNFVWCLCFLVRQRGEFVIGPWTSGGALELCLHPKSQQQQGWQLGTKKINITQSKWLINQIEVMG